MVYLSKQINVDYLRLYSDFSCSLHVFLLCWGSIPRCYLHLVAMSLYSPLVQESFSVLHCFMTLTVLCSTGQVFCRMCFNLGVYDVFSRDQAEVIDFCKEYLRGSMLFEVRRKQILFADGNYSLEKEKLDELGGDHCQNNALEQTGGNRILNPEGEIVLR